MRSNNTKELGHVFILKTIFYEPERYLDIFCYKAVV